MKDEHRDFNIVADIEEGTMYGSVGGGCGFQVYDNIIASSMTYDPDA